MAGGVCLTRNKLSNTYPWQRRTVLRSRSWLVLAMYELANCFRNGWGIKKDPAAAKQYYETAANLGDTDAMNEVAWCYTEGFGTKKDKVSKPCRPLLPPNHRCPAVYDCVTGQCRLA